MSLATDVDTLARTLWGEARGEGFKGMVAVAWVVRNRFQAQSRWGKTITAVCRQPYQFSCWNENDPNREKLIKVTADDSSFLRALGVAALVMTGDIDDPTDGADHYHTLDIRPSWADNMRVTLVQGHHRFLKEDA